MHRPACASISRWSHIIPSCIIAAYPACIKPPTSSSQPSPTSSQSHRSTSYSLINPCSSPPPSQLHNPMHAVMRLPPSDWREEHRQLRQRHHQYSETQATAASTVPVQSQSSLLLRRPASQRTRSIIVNRHAPAIRLSTWTPKNCVVLLLIITNQSMGQLSQSLLRKHISTHEKDEAFLPLFFLLS